MAGRTRRGRLLIGRCRLQQLDGLAMGRLLGICTGAARGQPFLRSDRAGPVLLVADEAAGLAGAVQDALREAGHRVSIVCPVPTSRKQECRGHGGESGAEIVLFLAVEDDCRRSGRACFAASHGIGASGDKSSAAALCPLGCHLRCAASRESAGARSALRAERYGAWRACW